MKPGGHQRARLASSKEVLDARNLGRRDDNCSTPSPVTRSCFEACIWIANDISVNSYGIADA